MPTSSFNREQPSKSSQRLYWACQLTGWLAFAVVELLFALAVHPGRAPAEEWAKGWAIAALDGLVATHLLYLYARRRRWLAQPGHKLILRLALAIPLTAAFLNTSDWIRNSLSSHTGSPIPLIFPMVLFTWGNWIIVLVAWTAMYGAIHEFRQRRRREVQGLRMEVATQQAQLRSLRAQLNPHFLFNCLNGLREMILEDGQRAQRMVEQLSALLRYSLRTNHAELVPFAQEVGAVKEYLALEMIRFEQRLQVRWNIAVEACGAPVPPMLLQSLVENALKHGIACRPQGGEIVISADVQRGELQLEVQNTGTIGNTAADGVGLRNARQRLDLLYGAGAKLALEDTGAGRVRARVNLPMPPPARISH